MKSIWITVKSEPGILALTVLCCSLIIASGSLITFIIHFLTK